MADELGVNWNAGTADVAETIQADESRCAYRPRFQSIWEFCVFGFFF